MGYPLLHPKLSPDGSNWITFKTHFLYAMGGRVIEGHFDRSEKPPTMLTLSSPDERNWTAKDGEQNEAYLAVMRKW